MSLDQLIMDDGVKLRVEVDGPKAAPAALFSHYVGCDMTLWNAQFRGETPYFVGWASGQYRSAARLHDGPDGVVGGA
jgi:hypothetical protein